MLSRQLPLLLLLILCFAASSSVAQLIVPVTTCNGHNNSRHRCLDDCTCEWCDQPIRGYSCMTYGVASDSQFKSHNCSTNVNKRMCAATNIFLWIIGIGLFLAMLAFAVVMFCCFISVIRERCSSCCLCCSGYQEL